MEREDQTAASVQREVRRRVRALIGEADRAKAKCTEDRRSGENERVWQIANVCLEAYSAMGDAAALLIAEIEGESAPEYADLMEKILRKAQADINVIFDVELKDIGASFPWHQPELQSRLDEVLNGVVGDFRLGLAGGVNVRKHQGGVSIGNAGQVNFTSPGASQNVGGDQIVAQGLDLAAIRAALQEQRELVARAGLPAEDADRIKDAIVNAERELDQPKPDQGRLRRFVGHVVTLVLEYGVSVAAGLTVAGLASPAG